MPFEHTVPDKARILFTNSFRLCGASSLALNPAIFLQKQPTEVTSGQYANTTSFAKQEAEFGPGPVTPGLPATPGTLARLKGQVRLRCLCSWGDRRTEAGLTGRHPGIRSSDWMVLQLRELTTPIYLAREMTGWPSGCAGDSGCGGLWMQGGVEKSRDGGRGGVDGGVDG